MHDSCPVEAARVIDAGLGEFNDRAAPLHEVQPISCLVRDRGGRVVGGVIGRRWGKCCELQQLWVEAPSRGQGLGVQLVMEFESHAIRKGCNSFYLETFNFQAPQLYEKLGYKVEYARGGYPHGIVKFHMAKQVEGSESAT